MWTAQTNFKLYKSKKITSS
ncbi:KxYKxGKxW signal peptide domain-containing protein [Parageobacillus thermoglucosidasius]